jgi:hypothetical protein
MWFSINFRTRFEHDCLTCQDSAHNIIALRGLRAEYTFNDPKYLHMRRRFSRQVSSEARHSSNNYLRWIDGARSWRYSQAQIPDLVANANPRFPQTAQSFGSAMPHARRYPAKSINSSPRRHGVASSRVFASDSAEVADRTPAADMLVNTAPVSAHSGRNRSTSTPTRPTGGPRFL